METSWDLFNNSNNSSVRGENGHFSSNPAWGMWEFSNASRVNWNNNFNNNNNGNNFLHQETINNYPSSSWSAAGATTGVAHQQESEIHGLMFAHQGTNSHHHQYATSSSSSSPPPPSSSIYSGGRPCYRQDAHLTCLKLGKRHYFENSTAAAFSITKKGKPHTENGGDGGGGGGQSTSAAVMVAAPATVPRCQVEGCNVVLVNAKDYHRRHKVCEVHSKSPKVVVLGVEQRFCQQCSRFHAVSEFDDSKRSCRRRLAGHNERRRKSSQDHSAPRNLSHDDNLMAGRNPYLPLNSGSALSLLSSNTDPWLSSADLSVRCSAALRELIAENRAAILARQIIFDRNGHWRPPPVEDTNELQNRSSSYGSGPQQMVTEQQNVNAGAHLTLDLKQTPSSAFGYLSVQGKSKEEECSELWGAFKGTRVL